MQNHCKRFFAKFVGKTLQTLAMFLAIYFAKLCTFLQSFLQNYCQIMQTLAKNFLQDFEHWSQRVGGHLFDGFFSFLGCRNLWQAWKHQHCSRSTFNTTTSRVLGV